MKQVVDHIIYIVMVIVDDGAALTAIVLPVTGVLSALGAPSTTHPF